MLSYFNLYLLFFYYICVGFSEQFRLFCVFIYTIIIKNLYWKHNNVNHFINLTGVIMKKIVLFGLFFIWFFFIYAQEGKQNPYDVNFNTSQNDAMFPGGNDSMMIFIWNHLNYPEDARNNNVSGEVQISFDVNFDGRVINFSKLSDLGYGLEDELIRVVKEMPLWIPATINNVKIRQQFILSFPISRYNIKND